jgi:hypothetical protein
MRQEALRTVVERVAQYDPATLDLAAGPTQDMLKKLTFGSRKDISR